MCEWAGVILGGTLATKLHIAQVRRAFCQRQLRLLSLLRVSMQKAKMPIESWNFNRIRPKVFLVTLFTFLHDKQAVMIL